MLLLALALPTLVRAAATDDGAHGAAEHYKRGRAYYQLGEYAQAAAEWREAYLAKQTPDLLFDIGQACRLAGQLEQARTAYVHFLDEKPDAPNRAQVRDLIRQLEKALRAKQQARDRAPLGETPPDGVTSAPHEAAATPTPTPAPAPGPTPPRPAPVPSAQPPVAAAPPTPPPTHGPAVLPPAPSAHPPFLGGGLAGGGALVAGVGGVLLALSGRPGSPSDYPTLAEYEGHAQTLRYSGAALLGVGGAALVVGSVMLLPKLLGRHDAPEKTSWLVVPAPNGLAFVWSAR